MRIYVCEEKSFRFQQLVGHFNVLNLEHVNEIFINSTTIEILKLQRDSL